MGMASCAHPFDVRERNVPSISEKVQHHSLMLIDQCGPWEKRTAPDGRSGQDWLVTTMESHTAALIGPRAGHASFVVKVWETRRDTAPHSEVNKGIVRRVSLGYKSTKINITLAWDALKKGKGPAVQSSSQDIIRTTE